MARRVLSRYHGDDPTVGPVVSDFANAFIGYPGYVYGGYPTASPIYGPPVPAPLPPTLAEPLALDMSESPCIGPFFDVNGPIGLDLNGIAFIDYCCICLSPCQITDSTRQFNVTDPATGKTTLYTRNADQLNWEHL